MSWDIELVCPECGRPVIVDRHAEGGTYAIGGIKEADLNITYNYSKHYYRCLNSENGLRFLNGKQAKDTIKDLESAVKLLGTKNDSDYWEATAGNAGYALSILLKWAKQYPNAVWKVI